MTKPPFPEWASSEISRLRSEADALERALRLYAGNGGSAASTGQIPAGDRRRGPRVSKYEPAFREFERVGRPLSIDEMIRIAGSVGLNIDRSNMRSQVFAQKQAGRARPEGDLYVWGLSLPSGGKPPDAESEPAGGVPAGLASPGGVTPA